VKGKELQRIRKQLAVTQTLLAKQLGVTANTVARWERDEMPIPKIAEVALKYIVEKHRTERER
jgi:DNA-binding transcriptional regulator YiaG